MKAPGSDAGNVRDALVALLCALAIAATGYSLYLEGATRLEAGDATLAGEIDFRSGEAHRRYADRALWERLDSGDLVYNRNSIRTGDGGSAASIRLKDDTRIDLDQATMIVLQISENEIRLQLKSGSLEIRRSRPRYERPLTVGRGDHVLELDSGEVRLESTDDPGMHVTPMLGSVVVRESSHRVRTGDRMTLSSAGRALQELGILLMPATPVSSARPNPAGGGKHPTGNSLEADAADPELTRVRLAWQYRGAASDSGESPEAQRPAPNDAGNNALKPAVVDISRDPAFTNSLRRVSRTPSGRTGQLEVSLAPGQYYWRVSQGSERSATGRFRIAPATTALRIITPAPGSEVRTTSRNLETRNTGEANQARNEASDVQFAWSADSGADHYRLQIFRRTQSGESAPPLVDRKVERDYVRVRLAPGDYQFRVQSFGASAGRSSSSPLTAFRLVSAVKSQQQPSLTEGQASATIDTRKRPLPENRKAAADASAAGAKQPQIAPARAAVSLLYPAPGQTVDMANQSGIVFRWRPLHADRPHRIRFYDVSRGAPRLLFERTTREGRARFTGLQELEHDGRYRWTVEALPQAGGAEYTTAGVGDQKAAASFRIILSSQPEQPQFLSQNELPEAAP